MARLTNEQVYEWAELCKAATPGPWLGEEDVGVRLANGDDVFRTGCGCCTKDTLTKGDATFIAAAREALPALLAERAELLAALQRLSESFRRSKQNWAEVHDKNGSLTACARSVVYGGCAEAVDKVRRGEDDDLVD